MFWSLCYLVLRRVLQLAVLRLRSDEFKELEIVVLRHELAVLQRQTVRAELRPSDRVFLAATSRLLPRASWRSFVVTPTTLLRWHRRLVTRRWTYRPESAGHRSAARSVNSCCASPVRTLKGFIIRLALPGRAWPGRGRFLAPGFALPDGRIGR